MDTVVVQIGNSDNRLTQSEWAMFCNEIRDIMCSLSHEIHFSGGSSFNMPQQNACWVAEVERDCVEKIRDAVTKCRRKFLQDSAAFMVGETEFI